ncbi:MULTISPECIES: hypothetical protein [Ensifer]|uniref:Uncharacterized protein n=1 Tax=Ensifer adhaerens TaxID=106592 RepID=A0ABY8HUU2_ENSAD|nr:MULTISPECIES: hypothetical protein [Ensifer]WFP95109.1 hypothetical protein P4B07_29005 [Ensifer adhaerens]
MKFRLSAGESFFLLGERKTIFDEASQQIFQLDELSAFLTCLLAEAAPAHQLEGALVARGVSRARAHASVQDYLAHLSRWNLLEIMFDENEGTALDTRHLISKVPPYRSPFMIESFATSLSRFSPTMGLLPLRHTRLRTTWRVLASAYASADIVPRV